MWCVIVVNRGLTTRVWGEQTGCTVCTVQNVWWKKSESGVKRAKWSAVRTKYVLQCHKFLLFATTKYSIEESHNILHNHVGGNTLGGTRGPGLLKGYSGTFATLQSIFDPLFFVHHSNVERQLCTWQHLHPESWNFRNKYTPQLESYPKTAPPCCILGRSLS
jgi:hypothetical protein